MNYFFFYSNSLNVIAVAFLDLSSLCNLSDPFNYIISDSGIFINHLVCWITCPFLRIKPISTLGHTYEGASENMNMNIWIWMIYLRKKLPIYQPSIFLYNQWAARITLAWHSCLFGRIAKDAHFDT